MSKSDLDAIIRKEKLDGLIGKTHMMILEQVSQVDRQPQEIFDIVNGKHEVSSFTQVLRAIDQLKRISCVTVTGEKTTILGSSDFGSKTEPTYKISELGWILLNDLKK